MEVNEEQEKMVEELNEKILELEKNQEIVVNDYEYRLLTVKNEM